MLGILGALAAVLIAGLVAFVLVRARRIRARHRAAFGAPLPALDPGRERLVESPQALYHGTRFAVGTAVLSPRWREPCVGVQWCTDEGNHRHRIAGGVR